VGDATFFIVTNAQGDHWFFLYGFEKKTRGNISDDELEALQEVAGQLLKRTNHELVIIRNAPDVIFRETGNLFIVSFNRPSFTPKKTGESLSGGQDAPKSPRGARPQSRPQSNYRQLIGQLWKLLPRHRMDAAISCRFWDTRNGPAISRTH